MRSSGGVKEHSSRCSDLISKVATQVSTGPEIDFPAEQLAELHFDLGDAQEPGDPAGFELDEKVDVTVDPELAAQGRSEQVETPNAMSATERAQLVVTDNDSGGEIHHVECRICPAVSHACRAQARA